MTAQTDATRRLVLAHWATANAGDWEAFAALLHPDLLYEVPQTREYIESGPGYLDMFRTWPGPWQARVQHLVCDAEKAVCIIDFSVGRDVSTGISVIEVDAGLIRKVTDYWPDPYEPPPRVTPWLQRRPA